MKRACTILALLLFAGNSASAADLTRMEWKVDGVTREALVYVPATAKTDSQPRRVRLSRPRRHHAGRPRSSSPTRSTGRRPLSSTCRA